MSIGLWQYALGLPLHFGVSFHADDRTLHPVNEADGLRFNGLQLASVHEFK